MASIFALHGRMLVVLFLSVSLIFLPTELDLSRPLTRFAAPAHAICLAWMPQTVHRSLYEAILCGKDLGPGDARLAFQQSGLYHVLVVSGAHLALLHQALKPLHRLKYGLILIFLVTTSYLLVCRGQPPIMRAWLQILVVLMAQRWRLHWRSPSVALVTGLLTLRLFPSWTHSYSFWFSWIASLAVSCVGPLKISYFSKVALVQLILSPVGIALGAVHPLCFLLNWGFAPLLSHLLLPMCLGGVIFHPLVALTDFTWTLILQFLTAISPLMGTPANPLAVWIFILYTMLAQWIWQTFNVRRLRND